MNQFIKQKKLMKPFLIFLFFTIIFSNSLKSQTIYAKEYGNKENPAIIFVHGGPSGNSTLFEGTTAENLANQGFFVIAYDRRGEGRSLDKNAEMTFDESSEDLLTIYQKYKIEKAHILGHSFGGIVATFFAEKHPEKVTSLILAGALVSQQKTYHHILKKAKIKFKNNDEKRKQISKIENLDKNSAAYRKQCFEIAGEMNFFKMPIPTAKSTELRRQYEAGDFYKTNFRNPESPIKFYKNETRNNVDNSSVLRKLKSINIPIYAIYGKDDGIFSTQQIKDLKKIVGKNNFVMVDNCSHYLFVDQQEEFLKFLVEKL